MLPPRGFFAHSVHIKFASPKVVQLSLHFFHVILLMRSVAPLRRLIDRWGREERKKPSSQRESNQGTHDPKSDVLPLELPSPDLPPPGWWSRILESKLNFLERGCSPAVEHMPCNQEAIGLNPTRCWACFLLSTFSFKWSIPNQVPQRGASPLVLWRL